MSDYELIIFIDNEFEIDVDVSPYEDTVWLSLIDMANLFDRDKTVVSRHIKYIFKEGELDKERTVAKNAQVQMEGSREVERIIELYNLDVIISVGYRVKSKRGILFRKWANNVLKQYLLKGYVLDSNRIIISKDNYIQLENDVQSLKHELAELKEKILVEPTREKLVYNGQFYDAHEFISSLIESAINQIIIVDPYFDREALKYLKGVKKHIEITICLSQKAKLTKDDIDAFEKQYNKITTIYDESMHDRFVIIDGENAYSIGTSLNYIGKKSFIVHKLEDRGMIDNILSRYNLNSPKSAS